MTATFLALGCCGLLAGPSSVVHAGEAVTPEQLIDQGVELRRSGHDDRAHGYFKRAYEMTHAARPAAQLGLVELAVKRYGSAHKHLLEALASDDVWVVENRSILEGALTTVRQHLASIEVVGPSAGAVIATSRDGAREEFPVVADHREIWLEPGSWQLIARAPGFKESKKDMTVTAGEHSRWAAALQPEAMAPTGSVRATDLKNAPEGRKGSWSTVRVSGAVMAGAGLGALVAGFFIHRSAAAKVDVIEKAAAMNPPSSYDPSADNWQSQDRLATGLLMGGAALAVVGTGLAIWGGIEPSAETQGQAETAFLPSATVHGAGFCWKGSF